MGNSRPTHIGWRTTRMHSGHFEVYVQSFPSPVKKWKISTAGGIAPRWRRDGRELFYIAPDGALMAVPVSFSADGQSLEQGRRRIDSFVNPLRMGVRIPAERVRQQYAVAPDGEHFLVNVTTDDAPPITIAQNWMAALRR